MQSNNQNNQTPNNLHLQFFSNPPANTQANLTAIAQALVNTPPIQSLNLQLNPPNHNAAAINGLAQTLNLNAISAINTNHRRPSGGGS